MYQYEKYQQILQAYSKEQVDLEQKRAALETTPLEFFSKHAESDLLQGDAEELATERILGKQYQTSPADFAEEKGSLLSHINKQVERDYAISDWLTETAGHYGNESDDQWFLQRCCQFLAYERFISF